MTLKEALNVLINEEHLEDWVYDVRERACSGGSTWKGSSWDHPRVKRFADACKALEDHLNEL